MADLIGAAFMNDTKANGAGTPTYTSGFDITQYDYTHGQLRTDAAHTIHYGTNKMRVSDLDADGAVLLKLGSSVSSGVELGSPTIKTTAKGDLDVDGSLDVAGNMTVHGTLTTAIQEEVLIGDNHLYLNNGYETTNAETGGLVVNYLPVGTTMTCATTGVFTASVGGADAQVTCTDNTTLAVGDFIQINGSASNDGIYEVSAYTGAGDGGNDGVIKIRSVNGANARQDDFTRNDFTAETDTAATIVKVSLSVMRAGTDGVWETAHAANNGANGGGGLTFADLATSAGSTLQTAYDAGNGAIITDATGNFAVSGSQAATFNMTGAVTLDSVVGISLDAGAASNFTTSGGALTLTSATAATWKTVAGILTLDGAGGVEVVGNAGEIDLTTSGAIDINSGAGTWDASTLAFTSAGAADITAGASSTWKTTAGTITIDAEAAALTLNGHSGVNIVGNAAEVDVTTSGALDLNSGTGTWDSSAGISLGAATTSDFTTAAGALTLNGAGGVNIDGNAAEIDVTTSGAVDINSGVGTWNASSLALTSTAAANITAGAASTWKTTAGAILIDAEANTLTLDGNSGVNIIGNASEIDLTTSAALDMNSGAGTWDASTLSLDSTDTTNLTMTATDAGTKTITLSATNAGAGVANMDVSADGTVNIDGDTAVTIDSSSGGVSIDGATASNFTTVAGALTLDGAGGLLLIGNAAEIDLTTSVALDLNSGAGTWDASTLSLDSTDDSNLTMSANDAADKTLAIAATNAGAGAGILDIDAGDVINIDTGDMNLTATTIDLVGAVTITGSFSLALPDNTANAFQLAEGANVYLDITTLDNAEVLTLAAPTAQGAVDIDAAQGITLDAAAANISLDAATASNFTTAAGALTLNGAGGLLLVGNAAEIDLTTSGAVDINSGAGTWNASTLALTSTGAANITAGAASTWKTTAGAIVIDAEASTLSLNGHGGVNIIGNAAEVDVTTTGALDLNSGAGTWDASAGISLQAAAASDFTTSAGKLTLSGDDGVDIVSSTAGQAIALKPTAETGGEFFVQLGTTALFGICWNAGVPTDGTDPAGDNYERGTLWIDYTNGHLYVNQGTKGVTQWVKVGSQS